ncbi:hypothetical protein AM493_05135 [Flavobacterium akiainvivens]|uniref:Uncharacterized protein n=1 Tax=Flavobacterium akiainvivens TaxID=1202724 RepID=A0A0M9VHN1_9FLAO|nr:hypothetical protein [Flavobacterium akiainvivens]KOS05482.1 hypothetical protein AM493_05135 [Flavobacterium akiainvivens]SFQ32837.1 hypothetical protein SAMN05444144_10362 [Flavobacterium akiainvivens]
MKSFLLTFIIILTALSFKKEQPALLATKTAGTVKDSVKVIDTLLVIDSLNFTNPKGNSILTEAIAQKVLEEYYAAKGIHNLETGYQDEEGNQMCAYYDTLYRYHLNNDNHEDGIIKYHIMPCLASGHCYQPTRAIITKINGKYTLISAELLPSYFGIDTITSDNKYNYLYFYKFNCPEHDIIARYRSKIPRY